MLNLGEVQRRLLYLFQSRRLGRELEEEMRFHLARREEDNRLAGVPSPGSAFAARRRFGNTPLLAEECHEVWGWCELEGLLRDVMLSFRSMRRNLALTAAIVITFAVGIGVNTALFGLGYALLMRPLAIPDPTGLKLLIGRTGEGVDKLLSPAAVRLLRDRSQSLSGAGIFGTPGPALVSVDSSGMELVNREQVDSGYFSVLGLRPSAGRLFDSDDDRVPTYEVVISHAWWTRHFNADPAAVGRSVRFNGRQFTIAGVTPAGFSGMTPERPVDLWFTVSSHPQLIRCLNDPGCTSFRVLARLKPGVKVPNAEAEIQGIFRGHLLDRSRGLPEPESKALLRESVVLAYGGAGSSPLGRQFRRPLFALIALAGVVLLLACVNISSMLLARSAAQSRETAIRLAIGAGRRHLVRQALAESLMYACLGGGLGLACALWGARVLAGLCSDTAYRSFISVGPDAAVLAFNALISVAAALLAGFIPAVRAAHRDVAGSLKGAGPGSPATMWHPRRVLAAAQMALSIMLLACAGLFARSLWNLKRLPPGFTPDQVVAFSVTTPTSYALGQGPAVWRLLDKVRRMPGVATAGMVDHPPPMANPLRLRVRVDGYTPQPGEDIAVNAESVSEGLFETLGGSFRSGRPIGEGDRNRNVAVVNEEFAARFFRGANPVGRHVDVEPEIPGHGSTGRFEIVGVVSGLRFFDPRKDPGPALFPNTVTPGVSSVLVRTSGPSDTLLANLPQMVRQAEPGLRVFGLETYGRRLEQLLARERLLAHLSAAFGMIAVILASTGLYGVMCSSVAQRTAELGIRIALGARRQTVAMMVLRETVVTLAAGLAIGVPAVLIGGKTLSTLLFGLKPADPAVIGTATSVIAVAALLAGFMPAHRASRIDPITALRQD